LVNSSLLFSTDQICKGRKKPKGQAEDLTIIFGQFIFNWGHARCTSNIAGAPNN